MRRLIQRSALLRPLRRLGKPLVYAYRERTAWARLLPGFLIVGAQRAGTTYLYDMLVGQPGVAPALTKEVHFFDVRYERGLRWYRTFFPPRLGRRPPLTGEASPYYMFHPHVPGRVAESLPQIKLIALLRNPVDRAYSQYQHERRRGFETLSFEQAIEREPERLAGEEERMLRDERYQSYSHQHHSYLARGVYAPQIERWLGAFPSEQLLIIAAERLYSHPGATLQQTLEFLELPAARSRSERQPSYPRYDEMDAGLRRRLTDYFAPHNQRLCKRLQMTFDW